MTKAHDLDDQSLWIDYMRRQFVADGGLQEMIDAGIRGVTSNPTIFEQAIAGSADYDEQMKTLVRAGKSADEIYEALVIQDIQQAADLLRPIYDESDGVDGYVSLEVSPTLANDTDATVAEAKRLYALLDRPNVMIKVPATPAGTPAIEQLIGEGININVTLMFSVAHYDAVAEAYLSGLEKLAANDGDLSKVASVASFFISRVESKVDAALEDDSDLQGKIAIANAKLAYARFLETFADERWAALEAKGARVQRPLWASTSTKNPHYPDTMYVDGLIGPNTVNTLPPETFQAFLDHGTVAQTLDADLETARAQVEQLAALRIDLNAITEELQKEGVEKFAASFESLMQSIEEKRISIQQGDDYIEMFLSEYQPTVEAAFDDLHQNSIMERIWQGDHTVWKDDPTEITNRLGWLRIMDAMHIPENLNRLKELARVIQRDGYTHVLLLGMGGSSLAPEVFSRTFGTADGHPELAVLDSTDPGAVLAYDQQLDPAKTLFIVATKSGGTAETLSFFKYFYNRTQEAVGAGKVGQHFVAITDPGSKLEDLAARLDFRATFLNDPNIGGRYSALSFFGLVPAALIGVNLDTLLERASTMAVNGGRLGTIMGEMAKLGRDKLTFITSPGIAAFGDWVEQLIAESTGKEGKGILPVVGEPVGSPEVYGDDRLFVHLRLKDDDSQDAAVQALIDARQPVVRVHLDDLYDIGGQYFLWEMATAVSGQRLGINPFDQPNVEAAKKLARSMIDVYQKEGKLPEIEEIIRADAAGAALSDFLSGADENAYIALQAYIQPTDATTEALQTLREALRDQYKRATTLGYGPRFLHSTGQLHKGDAGNGLFIQFTAEAPQDAPIPDEAGDDASAMSFDTLKQAQMLGDRQALLDAGRRVLTIDLGSDVIGTLKGLA